MRRSWRWLGRKESQAPWNLGGEINRMQITGKVQRDPRSRRSKVGTHTFVTAPSWSPPRSIKPRGVGGKQNSKPDKLCQGEGSAVCLGVGVSV